MLSSALFKVRNRHYIQILNVILLFSGIKLRGKDKGKPLVPGGKGKK